MSENKIYTIPDNISNEITKIRKRIELFQSNEEFISEAIREHIYSFWRILNQGLI